MFIGIFSSFFAADVRIYSFTIILSVDYLLKLGEFFKTEEAEKPVGPSKSKIIQVKSSTTVFRTETSKPSLPVASEQQPQAETQMTINLKLEKPDIILVEHMDNIDTNAMILNVCTLVVFIVDLKVIKMFISE